MKGRFAGGIPSLKIEHSTLNIEHFTSSVRYSLFLVLLFFFLVGYSFLRPDPDGSVVYERAGEAYLVSLAPVGDEHECSIGRY